MEVSMRRIARLLAPALGLGLAACGGTPPGPVVDPGSSTLPDCPESPNCVSSQADPADAEHHTEPLSLHGDPETAVARLQAVIAAHERTEIGHTDARVLRATYTSKLFGFVDDVELRVDAAAGVVHIRSASRVGKDDMEANPERVAIIRADWEATR
jgi:uncharacterized protein (DUF1499 family)